MLNSIVLREGNLTKSIKITKKHLFTDSVTPLLRVYLMNYLQMYESMDLQIHPNGATKLLTEALVSNSKSLEYNEIRGSYKKN